MAASLFAEFGRTEQDRLLRLARQSIAFGLARGQPRPVGASEFDGPLALPGASFVTLRKDGALRGCVGSIEALRPLAEDVAVAAFNAAFKDIRFPRLSETELDQIRIEVSVLSPMNAVDARDETELLQRLEPLVDGLLLEEGSKRATFLPKVWEQLPDPAEFVAALKRKAGLPADYWSGTLRLSCYRTLSFDEQGLTARSATGTDGRPA